MRRRSSFSEQRERRRRLLNAIGLAFILLLAYELVSGTLVAPVAVASRSMAPGLEPGDLVLVSSLAYGGRLEPFGVRLPGAREPERGDIALVEAPWSERPSALTLAADALLRLVTFQRVGLTGRSAGVADRALKRIIALPGDRLYAKDGVFFVKVPGAGHFLTEFEVSGRVYELGATPAPEGWSDELPLSDSYPELALGPDEYFLAGDDRAASADSRVWGPVGRERLLGRVSFRYWPFARFGKP
ncbi:MAG TPA: signal peptidase I [Spirochaetales bacterium]|nr:signal peptidase I [Spirochaetales bacterium]